MDINQGIMDHNFGIRRNKNTPEHFLQKKIKRVHKLSKPHMHMSYIKGIYVSVTTQSFFARQNFNPRLKPALP
jgi:hypothetical protein